MFFSFFWVHQFLPEDLRTYLEEVTYTGFEDAVYSVTTPLILLYLGSLVGLVFYKTWAKYIFTFCLVVGFLPFIFTSQPTVSHRLMQALGSLSCLVDGALLALIFVYDFGEKQKNGHTRENLN